MNKLSKLDNLDKIDINQIIYRIKNFIIRIYGSEKVEIKNNNILFLTPSNIYIKCIKDNLEKSSIYPQDTINTNYFIIFSNNINDTEGTYEPIYYSYIENRELINFDFIKKIIDCCNNFYKVKKLLDNNNLTKSIYFKFNPKSVCLKVLLNNNTGSLIYNLIHVPDYNNHNAYYNNSYLHNTYDLFDNYSWYKVDVNLFNEYEIQKALIS